MVTFKDINTASWRKEVGAFLIIMLLFTLYKVFLKKEDDLKGAYTTATLIYLDHEGRKIPGMQYQFGGNSYTAKLTENGFKKTMSKQKFVILLIDENPGKAVVISPVPDCLSDAPVPTMGWKELPKCK